MFNSESYLYVFFNSFLLHIIRVNGHGVFMLSCTLWYRSCNIVKLIVCIIVSNV